MRVTFLHVLSVVGALALAPSARAEAPGDFAAAMGLTAADGTVRTQAGVRLSLTPATGSGDYVVAMRAPVQAQLPELRRCFSEGMVRDAGVQGRVVVQLEALPKGKAKASVALDETGQTELATCMRDGLARAQLTGIKPGARALVAIELSNPAAAAVRQAQKNDAEAGAARVEMLAGGVAQTTGATQQGEVQFKIRGSAYAGGTLAALHRDLSSRLAGLLDCRRKASRRWRAAEGTITLDVKVGKGHVARATPASNGVGDRNAPACIATWLQRTAATELSTADLQVDVTFQR